MNVRPKILFLTLLIVAACGPAEIIDDPTARRLEERREAIETGAQAIEDESPRIARGECANAVEWSLIIEGYQSCQAMARDYMADLRAAYRRGDKDGVAEFKDSNSFRLWIGGWGINALIVLGIVGFLMIVGYFRRGIFTVLAGVRR